MRLEIDALAWDRGLKVASRDGRYAPALTRLEPQRAGPGSAHTSKVKPPGKAIRSPGPLHKTPRPAAEPYAVSLRSTAAGSDDAPRNADGNAMNTSRVSVSRLRPRVGAAGSSAR
jgi:hypothetical protein